MKHFQGNPCKHGHSGLRYKSTGGCVGCHRSPAWAERNYRNHIRRTYGLSVEDYAALMQKQGGRCAICGTEFTGTKADRPCIDHDHITDKVRGLLCQHCNSGLGHFADDTERMARAIQYVLDNKET